MAAQGRRVLLGTVTVEEAERLKAVFERKMALQGLVRALADMPTRTSDELYERLVKDYGEVERGIRQWWEEIHRKYQWENPPEATWSLEFSTRQVTLTFPSEGGPSRP
ncbi:MAG: CXXX repeat peptide modification system protein [Acetobacteraceae bacterium]|nr:CXXX repeat peptide modification system protein [Acetobacteraceae bacterium]